MATEEPVDTRACTKCGETKPLDEFYADKAARGGRRPECKACSKAAMAARYRANPEPARERAKRWNRENRERYDARMRDYKESGRKKISDRKSHLKRKYGLTMEQYDEMLVAQGGGCAICRRAPRDDVALHVDLCHRSGDVRGLLCFRCHNALGDFLHDSGLLEGAVEYLRAAMEHRARRRVGELVSPR